MERLLTVLFIFILSFLFGFSYKCVLRKLPVGKTRKLTHNIGEKDKAVRIGIGICTLVLAILLDFNPLLLFISGFAFFEAIFSWCGFYAAIGKNTCPIK